MTQIPFDFASEPPLIIISLKQKWHEAALSGEKKFEYRRSFLSIKSNAFVYVVGKSPGICAFAELGEPIVGAPDEIIAVYRDNENRSTEGIQQYLDGTAVAYAIPILHYRLIPALSLERCRTEFGPFHPPQSYVFLSKKYDLSRELLRRLDENIT